MEKKILMLAFVLILSASAFVVSAVDVEDRALPSCDEAAICASAEIIEEPCADVIEDSAQTFETVDQVFDEELVDVPVEEVVDEPLEAPAEESFDESIEESMDIPEEEPHQRSVVNDPYWMDYGTPFPA